MEGEELLTLFPQPKWLRKWDDSRRLTWESVFFNASATIRRGRQGLIGQRVLEIFSDYPLVVKTEDEVFVVILGSSCLSDAVDKKSLLEWGLINQEEYEEIKAEEAAAHNDTWTRFYLAQEVSSRKQEVLLELRRLYKEVKDKLRLLEKIDTMSAEEISALQQDVRELKASIDKLEQEKQELEELLRIYKTSKGATFQPAS